MHFSRQLNCWSLRCSWSIACRRCSNYIFILHLTLGFNILRKNNCKLRRETFEFLDLLRLLILETSRYVSKCIWKCRVQMVPILFRPHVLTQPDIQIYHFRQLLRKSACRDRGYASTDAGEHEAVWHASFWDCLCVPRRRTGDSS